jgi:hypothetical protein
MRTFRLFGFRAARLRHVAILATTIAASAAGLIGLAPPAQASGVLFDNLGLATNNNGDTAEPGRPIRYDFVASASGNAQVVQLWSQRLFMTTAAPATITFTDGSTVLGSGSFTPGEETGGSPICFTTNQSMPLVAGRTYRATLSVAAANAMVEWHTGNGGAGQSMKLSAASACGALIGTNPTNGSQMSMITGPGRWSFDTLWVQNDGTDTMQVTGVSFTNADGTPYTGGGFALLNGEPNTVAGTTMNFPKSIGTAYPGQNVGLIMYVACLGPSQQGVRNAVLNVFTTGGNRSFPVRCIVDSTPPTISFSDPDGTNGWFVSSPASIGVMTQDPESGGLVKLVRCSLNGVTSEAFASVLTVQTSTDGAHTLSCSATDVANNVGSASTTVKIDTTPPVMSISRSPNLADGEWTSADVTVSGLCSDATSGIQSQPTPTTFTSEGTHSTTLRCSDLAGHETVRQVSALIDRTKPVLTATQTPLPSSGWANQHVSVAFSCADSGTTQSGIAGYSPSPVLVTTAGVSQVAAPQACVDRAGNQADAISVSVRIDPTAPVVSVTGTPAAVTAVHDASLSFSTTETGGSGLVSHETIVDGVTQTPTAFSGDSASQSVNLTGPSSLTSHEVIYRATDGAGNVGQATVRWRVDQIAPETSIVQGPLGPQSIGAASLVFTGQDNESIGGYECSLNGSDWARCDTGTVNVTGSEGENAFSVRAVDGVGNTDATPAVRRWVVDTEAPSLSLVNWPSSSNRTNATVSFTAQDAGTGVASVTCTVDGVSNPCVSPLQLEGLSRTQHTVVIRAVDAVGNASTVTHAWTVDSSVTATDDTASTDEDTAVTLDVLSNDINPISGAMSVESFSATSAQGGSITRSGASLRYNPPSEFSGTDTFTYKPANTSGDASQPATVSITVKAVNDTPTLRLTSVVCGPSGADAQIWFEVFDIDSPTSDLVVATTLRPADVAAFGVPTRSPGSANKWTVFVSRTHRGSAEGVVSASDGKTSSQHTVQITGGTDGDDAATGTIATDIFLGGHGLDTSTGFVGDDALCTTNAPMPTTLAPFVTLGTPSDQPTSSAGSTTTTATSPTTATAFSTTAPPPTTVVGAPTTNVRVVSDTQPPNTTLPSSACRSRNLVVGTAACRSLRQPSDPEGARFTITKGRLPNGLRLSTSGMIRGVPTAPERVTVTVLRSGGGSPTVRRTVVVQVNAR